MKKIAFLFAGTVLLSVSALAQTPTIAAGGVFQGATFSPSGLPNAVLAQGGFFTIFGTNLGPATSPALSLPLQSQLGNVSVTVVVNGTNSVALMVFVSPGQINAILPSATPVGTGTVSVKYNGATSATAPLTVVASNFGALTYNGGGTGPAIVQVLPAYSLETLTASAQPGNTLVIYGTGLGPNPGGDQNTTTGVVTQTSFLGSNYDFHLYLGLTEVTSNVLYAGRSGFAGLDQIDLTLPSNAPSGCYVPLVVRIGSLVSNFGTVSIAANGGTCSDPYGLTPSQINSAVSGNLSVASLLLTRLQLNISSIAETEDNASAHFYQFEGANYYDNPEHTTSLIGISSFGSCQVTSCSNQVTCVPTAGTLPLPQLNAGSALSVSGNGAPTTSVPQSTTSGYVGTYAVGLGANPLALPGYPSTPDNFLKPGTFTFSGTGGSDIPAFSASVTVPTAFSYTTGTPAANQFSTNPPVTSTSTTINRSNDLTVTWNGGGSSDYFLVAVSSATSVNTYPTGQTNSSTITCLQPATTGTLTIPSWLLQALPASGTVSLGPLSGLPGAAILGGIFDVDNTFSGAADVNFANSIVTSGINVTLQ